MSRLPTGPALPCGAAFATKTAIWFRMQSGSLSARPPPSSRARILSPSTLQVAWLRASRARRSSTSATSPRNGMQHSGSLRRWPPSSPSALGLGRPIKSSDRCCLARRRLRISLPLLILLALRLVHALCLSPLLHVAPLPNAVGLSTPILLHPGLPLPPLPPSLVAPNRPLSPTPCPHPRLPGVNCHHHRQWARMWVPKASPAVIQAPPREMQRRRRAPQTRPQVPVPVQVSSSSCTKPVSLTLSSPAFMYISLSQLPFHGQGWRAFQTSTFFSSSLLFLTLPFPLNSGLCPPARSCPCTYRVRQGQGEAAIPYAR